MGSLAGGERVFQIIDEKAEEDEGYVTLVNCKEVDGQIQETTERTHQWAWKHFHKADGTTTYVPLKGDIEFEDVTFSYVEGKVVLKTFPYTQSRDKKLLSLAQQEQERRQ